MDRIARRRSIVSDILQRVVQHPGAEEERTGYTGGVAHQIDRGLGRDLLFDRSLPGILGGQRLHEQHCDNGHCQDNDDDDDLVSESVLHELFPHTYWSLSSRP